MSDDDLIVDIIEKAHGKMRTAQRGMQGQTMMPQDSVDWWIAKEALSRSSAEYDALVNEINEADELRFEGRSVVERNAKLLAKNQSLSVEIGELRTMIRAALSKGDFDCFCSPTSQCCTQLSDLRDSYEALPTKISVDETGTPTEFVDLDDDALDALGEPGSEKRAELYESEQDTGRCRFRCRTNREAYIAGYLQAVEDCEDYDHDPNERALEAYHMWKKRNK